MLKSKSVIWGLLVISLSSLVSIRRKLLKTTHSEKRSVQTNSESCNILLGSYKNKFNYEYIIITIYNHQTKFYEHSYTLYLKIFLICFIFDVLTLTKILICRQVSSQSLSWWTPEELRVETPNVQIKIFLNLLCIMQEINNHIPTFIFREHSLKLDFINQIFSCSDVETAFQQDCILINQVSFSFFF